jgi:hypothetical protein
MKMTKGYTAVQRGQGSNGSLTNGGPNRKWYIVAVDELGRHGYPLQQLPSFEKRSDAKYFIEENGKKFIH